MTQVDQVANRSDASRSGPDRRHFAGFEILRAAAALMVVVHHADALSAPSSVGPLATPAAVMDGGVAIFFVLSGFLIYRPFVASQISGSSARSTALRWRSFWWRRILRIVPAYWVVLSFFWALGSFDLGANWWRYYLFVQIYWPDSALNGVVQAWSLCTELTFYLLLPLWAALVGRVVRGRSPSVGLVVHGLGTALLWSSGWVSRWAIEEFVPSRRGIAFNWLPTNLDLFATGMALAVLSVAATRLPEVGQRLDRLAGAVLPWWSAAVVVFAWYAYGVGPTSFEAGYSGWFWHRRQMTFAVVSVLLLVPAVFGDQARGAIRRVWSLRPLVWVGTVSYGLYLWHLDWMERAVAGPSWAGWTGVPAGEASFATMVAVGLGLGLLFAALSWYLLEKPVQRLRSLPSRARAPSGRSR